MSSFKVRHHELLQFSVFLIIEIQAAHALKSLRLDESEHMDRLRLWRSPVKCGFVAAGKRTVREVFYSSRSNFASLLRPVFRGLSACKI